MLDKKTLNQIKQAVSALQKELAVRVDIPRSPLLLTIDEVCPHIPLRQLKEVATYDALLLKSLQVKPEPTVFDVKFANWFFAATKGWRPASQFNSTVSLATLRSVMPPNTVSPKATHVAVWPPILRAFERIVGKTTMIGEKIITIIYGGDEPHLTCIDLDRRTFACTCKAFNADDEQQRKRHVICKHLFRAIYHHYETLFTAFASNMNLNPWRSSLEQIERGFAANDKRVLLANWVYYFTKNVFANLGMYPGRFEDLPAARNLSWNLINKKL